MIRKAPGLGRTCKSIYPVIGITFCIVKHKDEAAHSQENIGMCQGPEKAGNGKGGQPGKTYGHSQLCCPVYRLSHIEISSILYDVQEGYQQNTEDLRYAYKQEAATRIDQLNVCFRAKFTMKQIKTARINGTASIILHRFLFLVIKFLSS